MIYLATLSIRALGLGLLAGLALKVLRVRSASAKHAVWTIVTAVMLLQVVISPALPTLPIKILASATDPAPTPEFVLGRLPVPVSDSHVPARQPPSWRTLVIGAYLAISAVLFARLLLGYIFTRTLVRSSRPIDDRLRESESISVPLTVGQLRPTILLPTSWREWDSAKLRAVLAHEEAHIRRWDWAIGLMARINCCVFWFHPLAWWLKRELALLAEHACDDFVLTQIGDRQQYARALLEIASAMRSAQGRLVAMSMAKETNVQKRLDQILDETRPIPPAFGRRGWVMLLVCSLPVAYLASSLQLAHAQTAAAIPVVQAEKTAGPTPPAKKRSERLLAQAKAPAVIPTQTQAPAASPYKRWLDEEVTWIISDEERRAFQLLKADEEREHFIEQFWLRRDPTPATDQNEFKEEIYRRIAWANDKFTAGILGWETDRGIVYIKYGPPDAIDSHGATPATYPYEVWRYRDISGFGTTEFEFVDPTMTGRYHLTKDPTEKEARR